MSKLGWARCAVVGATAFLIFLVATKSAQAEKMETEDSGQAATYVAERSEEFRLWYQAGDVSTEFYATEIKRLMKLSLRTDAAQFAPGDSRDLENYRRLARLYSELPAEFHSSLLEQQFIQGYSEHLIPKILQSSAMIDLLANSVEILQTKKYWIDDEAHERWAQDTDFRCCRSKWNQISRYVTKEGLTLLRAANQLASNIIITLADIRGLVPEFRDETARRSMPDFEARMYDHARVVAFARFSPEVDAYLSERPMFLGMHGEVAVAKSKACSILVAQVAQ